MTIIVISACECKSLLKWAAMGETSVLLCKMSEWWLFILQWKGRPVSPTYCWPHLLHVIRYIILEDLQEALIITLNCSPVVWLNKASVANSIGQVPLILLTVEKINVKISILFFFLLLSFSHSFFFSLMHNSKSIGHIPTILTANDWTAIRDFLFLGYSCMWAKIYELWLQTCVVVAFLFAILCVITFPTQKLKLV